MQATYLQQRHRRSKGFSLIELMVGIVVAMAAVIVVMQVFKMSEGARRTTTGGDDAQTIGAIALTVLQRDLRQAGQGLTNPNLLNCDLLLRAGVTLNGLAPLTINHADIPAGDAGTDTLLIVYGSGLGSPEGDRINTQAGAAIYSVSTPSAFRVGDLVIAAPAVRQAPCGLLLSNVAAAPVAPNVTVAFGTAGVANGTLYNWGTTPRVVAYAVRNGRLTTCDFLTQNCRLTTAANWAEVADGVVSLRAEYGRDSTLPPDAVLDGYDQTTPTTAAGWNCILATRLVLVARNGQLESSDVTASAPTWAAGASAPIGLTGNWKRYRYKTFETTVPLRNVAWQGVPTGC
ncbi:PilW family protein [Paucibacter sp. TC2R-5]|uniref:PilW family protein n=1 Tax=Paucibacter sp. TC2R-5 TaxID=2893555 RepID=UPI0021E38A56|nr:PilW family protein [Paucibacter sp. TC2R-5]MCV2359497.1 PilW family protein [Paucibacter sp. TC2R-5]